MKQQELFEEPLGVKPKTFKERQRMIAGIFCRWNKQRKPETKEEYETADEGGTDYWSTFRR